jgi:hypothetical protein
MSKIELSPTTEYGLEKGTVRYFINLLENRLAGRNKGRIVKRVPADECRLGVLIPWRKEVDEVDPLESEEGQDGAEAALSSPADGSKQEGGKSKDQGPNSPPAREDDEYKDRPQPEGKDDQDYVRRPPSSLGAEFLLESREGHIVLEIDASFAIYTPHLPHV